MPRQRKFKIRSCGCSEIVGNISALQTEMEVMKSTIKTLVGHLATAEITTERQQSEIIEVKSYSMKNNIITNFDINAPFPPKPNESTQDHVMRFFRDVRSSEIYIPVAHFLGPASKKNRPILVKIPDAGQFSRVMRHAKNLAGLHHSITRQLPPEKRERKKYVLPIMK